MKRLLSIAALVLPFAFAGCSGSNNVSSTGGVPGEPSFRLINANLMGMTVKQGASDQKELKLDRDKGYAHAIAFETASVPKGLHVEMMPTTVKASDGPTVAVKVTADKDAPEGKAIIKITAKPDKGNPVTVDFEVTVAKP
jgi:hypothetical protein